MAKKIESEWRKREQGRLRTRKDRINKIGQGRPYELGSFANLLLTTILYFRTTFGYELLGLLVGVDGTTVKRAIRRVSPLLQDRFIPKTALSKNKRRINNLDEFLEQYPELKEVIFGGSELPTQRPKKRQKQQYSGKKKCHTKKVQVVLDKDTKLIVGLSPSVKSRMHDKEQLERTGWDDKLSDKVKRRGDLGYFGMPSDTLKLPFKKPRNKELTRKRN